MWNGKLARRSSSPSPSRKPDGTLRRKYARLSDLRSEGITTWNQVACETDGMVLDDSGNEVDPMRYYTGDLKLLRSRREPDSVALHRYSISPCGTGRGEELNRIYVGYDELLEGLTPLKELGVSRVVLRHPPVPPPPEVRALFERVAGEATLLHAVSPFERADGPPYLDNEDWPPRASLSHRGPMIEIWALAP